MRDPEIQTSDAWRDTKKTLRENENLNILSLVSMPESFPRQIRAASGRNPHSDLIKKMGEA